MAHRIPMRRAALVALALVALMLGLVTDTFTVLAGAVNRRFASPAITNPLPAARLDQVVVANGISVRLTSVEFASDATTLRLELGRGGAPVTDDTFLPITPDRLAVTGIGGDPDTFGAVAFGERARGE